MQRLQFLQTSSNTPSKIETAESSSEFAEPSVSPENIVESSENDLEASCKFCVTDCKIRLSRDCVK